MPNSRLLYREDERREGNWDGDSHCLHCQQIGHRAKNCPTGGSTTRHGRTGGMGGVCFCCFRYGHAASTCRWRHQNCYNNVNACYYCGRTQDIVNERGQLKRHTAHLCIAMELYRGNALRSGFEKWRLHIRNQQQ